MGCYKLAALHAGRLVQGASLDHSPQILAAASQATHWWCAMAPVAGAPAANLRACKGRFRPGRPTAPNCASRQWARAGPAPTLPWLVVALLSHTGEEGGRTGIFEKGVLKERWTNTGRWSWEGRCEDIAAQLQVEAAGVLGGARVYERRRGWSFDAAETQPVSRASWCSRCERSTPSRPCADAKGKMAELLIGAAIGGAVVHEHEK